MTTPAVLEGATSAFVYFDPRRAERYAAYRGWTSVIRRGDDVTLKDHQTEADARAYLGLEGGSPDPDYRPLRGSTGFIRAIGEEAADAA